ncbi:anti-adapter protein iraM [Leclercia tamurae]|uniref:Anti-adapter protein iraM n=1 Tax=Leclercia tamurae TaxID=2926467 RepID=A0ABT2RF29_9ENTR|nr:anti-adapter protein iraM [Leclercia tamurae]MCU6679474.1 anti-adapter protein iraM [Leclercia tamurae]
MYWVVENRMVCPRTGTIFIHVLTVKNLRLIIWYKGDYFISIGSVLVTGPFGIAIDGKLRKLHIMRTFSYNPSFWSSLLANSGCPGNHGNLLTRCEHRQDCVFALCPYGAISS